MKDSSGTKLSHLFSLVLIFVLHLEFIALKGMNNTFSVLFPGAPELCHSVKDCVKMRVPIHSGFRESRTK